MSQEKAPQPTAKAGRLEQERAAFEAAAAEAEESRIRAVVAAYVTKEAAEREARERAEQERIAAAERQNAAVLRNLSIAADQQRKLMKSVGPRFE